jgi:hypothetical protein
VTDPRLPDAAPAGADAATAPVVPSIAQIAANPMPARRAELDHAAARADFAAVSAILATAANLDDVNRNMSWEQLQILQGGGVFYGFRYMDDLWMWGAKVTTDPNAEMAKLYAGVIALYLLQQISIDGARSADPSAPGHRSDQLIHGRQPLWAYVMGLPEITRRDLAVEAMKLEARTAKLRRDDPLLCSGGAADMAEALKNDNRPLGSVSGQLDVHVTPHPAYVDPAVSAPKQAQIRAAMPMVLARALKLPEAQGK